MLELQRSAGNRAVCAIVADPVPRTLARCAGRCTCGGRCSDDDESLERSELFEDAQWLLRGAVLKRRERSAEAAPKPPVGLTIARTAVAPGTADVRTLSRVKKKACGAPSASTSGSVASAFGRAIEGLVDLAYMKDRGINFTDVYADVLSKQAFVKFLSNKHGIPESTLSARVTNVPDLLDTRTSFSASGQGEIYEIKPNSKAGTKDGQSKLRAIDAYMRKTPVLPYERGDTWSPGTISIPIPLTAILSVLAGLPGLRFLAAQLASAFAICGAPDVTLELARTEPGLVQYRLCVEADFECYAKVMIAEDVLIGVIAIVVVAIVAPETIPVIIEEAPEIIEEIPELIEELPEIIPETPPVPELPPPGPPMMPPPVPVPVPIPAPPP